jgi:hypothetical protein
VLWDRATDAAEDAAQAPSRRAIYRTIDRTYEAEIVRQLGRFFVKGAVYYGDKPVHWCFSCKTALAEAEVEYEDRTDPSVYVKMAVRASRPRSRHYAARRPRSSSGRRHRGRSRPTWRSRCTRTCLMSPSTSPAKR